MEDSRKAGRMRQLLIFAVAAASIPAACVAQTQSGFDWQAKLNYHAGKIYDPMAIVGFAAYAGILQGFHSPEEWGQGGAGYGRRVASTAGWAVIHSTLAFGLDSTLHQDPRYYRSVGTGFWQRAGHALRGTILTRTDAGAETLATWRIGSSYGAAFLSNMWYPDRLNTVRLGVLQGTMGLGFDFANNLGSEFWPDVKRKLFHK